MIYILSGNDNKKKNIYLKKLLKDKNPIFLQEDNLEKKELFSYAGKTSLFGDTLIIILDSIIKNGEVDLTQDDLNILKDSPNLFVFLEDKLLAVEEKKYKKYAQIEKFNTLDIKQKPKTNTFAITDSFASRDKIMTWFLYRKAIMEGSSPEEISGILFWKIKKLLQDGSRSFKEDELKKNSSDLISLYHRAHMGECDFTIGIEQFILKSLSKK